VQVSDNRGPERYAAEPAVCVIQHVVIVIVVVSLLGLAVTLLTLRIVFVHNITLYNRPSHC